ncbi:MAG TPA: isoprenylcysteine carboxylmethyltransferase family protein [Candidatus Acidoferrales bacterium]|nr:isoprenylcysteine carboxylmethyltransferase family protein [Candidatus Acidoferrales bacterium]
MAQRKFWMRWRVRTGYPVALLFLVLASPTPRVILIGAFVSAFGLAIRGYASGYLRKDRDLATSGPYARARNPLYLGSAILAAGFVVAGHSVWAGILVALYFSVFYYAVMRNEEEDLRKRFGTPFDEYAKRVPLLFPSLTAKSSGPATSFSWSQYSRNREYKALIGTALGVGVMWLRMYIRRRFGY